MAVDRAVRDVYGVPGTEQSLAIKIGHDHFMGLNRMRMCAQQVGENQCVPMVAITTFRSVRSLSLLAILFLPSLFFLA